MPNDAKLAMVIGVGLVVAVAIVFFHKDIANGRPPGDKTPTNGVSSPAAPPARPGDVQRPLATWPTGLVKPTGEPRRHTVEEGDTLFGLAERYYGDGDRFADLYRYNRAVLKRPDRLEVGTVLTIPDLPEAP
jgi:nucleoid-associated protein YgaU